MVCGIFSLFGILIAVVTLTRLGKGSVCKSFIDRKIQKIFMFGMVIIILVSTAMLFLSVSHMVFFHTLFPPQLIASWIAVMAAAGSLGFMEWMGTQAGNVPELEEDIIFVLQTDFMFSILVVTAIVSSRMGIYILDPACAIFISFLIIFYSVRFFIQHFIKGVFDEL